MAVIIPAHFLRVSPFRSRASAERYWLTPEHDLLLVLTTGAFCWEAEGQTHRATVGDVVYHPAGQPYLEWTSPDETAAGCKITMDWQGRRQHIAWISHDERGVIRAAAERLLAIWYEMASREQVPDLRDSAHLIFYGIIGELLELNRDDTPTLLRELRDFVMREPARSLNVAALAAHSGYDPAYYSRKFRAATGQSPMQAVRRIRLDLARELLLNTRQPAKTIARVCGFSDGAHLAHLFRREYHTTIRDLRRTIAPA